MGKEGKEKREGKEGEILNPNKLFLMIYVRFSKHRGQTRGSVLLVASQRTR